MNWQNIPPLVEKELREEAKKYEARCEKRKLKRKHKYAYILGRNKKETQKLKNIFEENNQKFSICESSRRFIHLPYPKQRGQ